MLLRFCSTVVLGSLLCVSASAQTVRFDTNVGNFDVVLNPNGLTELLGHVDNFLAYVDGGFYNNLLIHRSPDNFVMQLGRFQIGSIFPPNASSDFNDNINNRFDPVTVDADNDGTVDFDTEGLTNTRGMISLALSGTDSNSGTSEFFVNLSDNSRLDAQEGSGEADFVPFAFVPDMSTIDLIFKLKNENLFSGAFEDVRMLNNNTLVYVEKAFVIAATPEGSSGSATLESVSVPEPPSLVLAIGALVAIYVLKPSKRG